METKEANDDRPDTLEARARESWIQLIVGAVAMKRGDIAIAQVVASLMVLMLLVTTIEARAVADTRSSVESPTTQLAVVSEDPYTNVSSYHRTEVEPDSFAFGSTIVATFQAGRFEDSGASNLGWSVSTDAGATWRQGFLPGTTIRATPPGMWRRVSDPEVAYDAMHATWLIVGVGARSRRPIIFDRAFDYTVFVSRSTDGAQSFSEPVIVRAWQPRHSFDKPWIVCDNTSTSTFYGHCYAQWDDFGRDNRLWMSTSTDGGLTWTKADVPRGTCVFGGQPLVQPDGTVVVPMATCDIATTEAFISTDGGETYVGPFHIGNVNTSAVHGDLREKPIPSADVDADGTVYVVWHDCQFRDFGPNRRCTQNDIVMSTTTDGRHWSNVVRIPIDPRTSSVDHFLPGIAIDPATAGASVHIVIVSYFYADADCNRATCELSVGFSSSIDGGGTWTSQQLAGPFRTTWFPLTTSGYMVGDYISVSFVGGQAIPVFTVGTEGTCERGDITACNVWTASATIPLVPGS